MLRPLSLATVAGVLYSLATMPTYASPYIAQRLNAGQPIITPQMFADLDVPSEGGNINGPSMVAVPDWLRPKLAHTPAAAANYLLYFGDHQGDYIRMAWAEQIGGPYHLYQTGRDVATGQRGVLDLGSDDRIDLANNLQIRDHIASPHVQLDHANKRVVMHFHGPARHNNRDVGQKSFVATSDNGLSFAGGVAPVILGLAYFHVFQAGNATYAVASRGSLYRAPEGDPWTAPAGFDYGKELWTAEGANPSDNPFQHDIDANDPPDVVRARHFAVRVVGDRIEFFYTRVGDAPERILLSTVDADADNDGIFDPFGQWNPSYPPIEILRPESTWEGASQPLTPSSEGSVNDLVNQLRDPFIFEKDGEVYLLYVGGGETAIGIVRLVPEPGTAALFGVVGAGLFMRRRSR